jgi:hypothetical protein
MTLQENGNKAGYIEDWGLQGVRAIFWRIDRIQIDLGLLCDWWTLVCGSVLRQRGRNVCFDQSYDDLHLRLPYRTSKS